MLRDVPEDPSKSHFGVHFRTKAVLLRQQVRLEDRPDDQHHGHLYDSISDGRDTERALSAIALGNPYAQQGLGRVAARDQLLSQCFQPRLHSLGFDLLERLSINPGRASISAGALVSFS